MGTNLAFVIEDGVLVRYAGVGGRVIVPDCVEVIGREAFAGCAALESVACARGSHLRRIGPRAFEGCRRLASISLPPTVEAVGEHAFADCRTLAAVEFCGPVRELGAGAFRFCAGLRRVTLPPESPLAEIGEALCELCTSLTTFELPRSVASIGEAAFFGCAQLVLKLPPELRSIGAGAFEGCKALTTAELPATLEALGDRAFCDCSGLVAVGFAADSALRAIGGSAFRRCSALKAVEIPASVEVIDIHAFGECAALERVAFGEGSRLRNIWAEAFCGCFALAEVRVPPLVPYLARAFDRATRLAPLDAQGLEISDGQLVRAMGPAAHVVVPEGVVRIGEDAFLGNKDLVSVELPASLREIGLHAFDRCAALERVTFAAGSELVLVMQEAFARCSSLAQVRLPGSIKVIGDSAFRACAALERVSCERGARLGFVGSWAFRGCAALARVELPEMGPLCAEDLQGCTPFARSAANTFLTQEDLGHDVESCRIAEGAFFGCASLKGIEIPAGVADIRPSAFEECAALGRVTFAPGSRLRSVGWRAFALCPSLEPPAFPSAADVDEEAFWQPPDD